MSDEFEGTVEMTERVLKQLESQNQALQERIEKLEGEHGPCSECGHDRCIHSSFPFGCSECKCRGSELLSPTQETDPE